MNKEITPEILDILRRDAKQNLTDVQRTYLLSEQGWTESADRRPFHEILVLCRGGERQSRRRNVTHGNAGQALTVSFTGG